jgi:hypothetical protein
MVSCAVSSDLLAGNLNCECLRYEVVQASAAEVQVGRLDAPHQSRKSLVAGNQVVGPVDPGMRQLPSDFPCVELVEKSAQDLGFRIVLIG